MTREEIKKQWELEFGAKYEEYQRANVYTATDILDFAESVVNKLLISGVVSTCCEPIGEGFFLGTSCPKCKQPFRQVIE